MSNNDTKKVGNVMLVAAMIVAMAMLTWFFGNLEEQQRNPNQQPESLEGPGHVEVVLQRNRAGHYVANGTINGTIVEFLLDTGATDVVIGAGLAAELGLRRGRPGRAVTANGTITIYATEIEELTIGNIKLYRVAASINPSMNSHAILMGMSALGELEFVQRGDQLRLRQLF